MRAAGLLVSLALGCGRIGFEVCAGCSGPATSIDRVQAVAPGAQVGSTMNLPMQVAAGDVLLVAFYYALPDMSPIVSDSLGSTFSWMPAESTGTCVVGGEYHDAMLRFAYTTLAAGGSDTVTIVVPTNTTAFGAFAIEYSGVASVEVASGQVGATDANMLDAGPIMAVHNGTVVAGFLERIHAPQTMQPGTGFQVVAHDDQFSAIVEERSVSPGSYSPTASLPGGTTSPCWVGASVALRAL